MKGMVFTEFLDMVDSAFSPEMTETIIENSDLPSGGAYTSAGTYDHSEIVALVVNLSKETKMEVPILVHTFGKHLLGRFYALFPEFFSDTTTITTFLAGVDGYIHREVRKLYPDATLPQISTEELPDGDFVLNYKSDRMMGDLAEGLISGAVEHFGNTHVCHRQDLENEEGAQCVRFRLTPKK